MTSSHGRAKTGRPARTYIQQLCANTGCSLEDLPEAMDDREGWWERVREIRTDEDCQKKEFQKFEKKNVSAVSKIQVPSISFQTFFWYRHLKLS